MVANLNVQLFTPCLVFTKLASQLNADKLADLAVIPVIFIAQTLISWLCATLVSKAFGFKKRQSNFVVAMAVSRTPCETCSATDQTGLRKLQLPAYLSCHLALQDYLRSALGQAAR